MFLTIQSLYSHESHLLPNPDKSESKDVKPNFLLLRHFLYGRGSETVYITPLVFSCVATAAEQDSDCRAT